MEATGEEVQCMEETDFGNVRLAACIGPPKRPTQTASQVGPSFVQCFGSDQQEIGSCKMSMEAAEEEESPMGKSILGNARPIACIGPPRMLAQIASYVRPSDILHFSSDQRGIAS